MKITNDELVIVRMRRRERQVANLLLKGCDNAEISSILSIAPQTVKKYLKRLFLRFGVNDGIKRVKLAVILYRRQQCLTDMKNRALQMKKKKELLS